MGTPQYQPCTDAKPWRTPLSEAACLKLARPLTTRMANGGWASRSAEGGRCCIVELLSEACDRLCGDTDNREIVAELNALNDALREVLD